MKKVPVVRVVRPDVAAKLGDLPDAVSIAVGSLRESMRDGLMAMSVAVGLVTMRALMDEEITAVAGARHARVEDRAVYRHGVTRGQVVVGGRKLSVERPRARTTGGREVELDTWNVFSNDDLLTQVVVERMLAGVATRRHQHVAEPVGDTFAGTATSKSAVSQRWVKATEHAIDELLARDLSGLDPAVLMIDGLDFAGDTMVVALIITTDGTKVPVGLAHGDTENATVVKGLLADLVDRGLRYEAGMLVVLDGGKALRKAIKSVFGRHVVVQRCTIHKRRNVTGYLPKARRRAVDQRLAKIFADPDPTAGLRKAQSFAKELELAYPDAAASLREGLDEMFTVARIGATPTLRCSLCTTNAIESMISIARTTTRNVKNWRDGAMRRRWCAAGMLEAEHSFRRIKGHTELAVFTETLRAHINKTNSTTETVIGPEYTHTAP